MSWLEDSPPWSEVRHYQLGILTLFPHTFLFGRPSQLRVLVDLQDFYESGNPWLK